MNVLTDQVLQHVQRPLEGLVRFSTLGRWSVCGVGQQLPGEVDGAFGRLAYFGQIHVQAIRRIDLLKGDLRMCEDHQKHVVEIMSHSAGQSPLWIPIFCAC